MKVIIESRISVDGKDIFQYSGSSEGYQSALADYRKRLESSPEYQEGQRRLNAAREEI